MTSLDWVGEAHELLRSFASGNASENDEDFSTSDLDPDFNDLIAKLHCKAAVRSVAPAALNCVLHFVDDWRSTADIQRQTRRVLKLVRQRKGLDSADASDDPGDVNNLENDIDVAMEENLPLWTEDAKCSFATFVEAFWFVTAVVMAIKTKQSQTLFDLYWTWTLAVTHDCPSTNAVDCSSNGDRATPPCFEQSERDGGREGVRGTEICRRNSLVQSNGEISLLLFPTVCDFVLEPFSTSASFKTDPLGQDLETESVPRALSVPTTSTTASIYAFDFSALLQIFADSQNVVSCISNEVKMEILRMLVNALIFRYEPSFQSTLETFLVTLLSTARIASLASPSTSTSTSGSGPGSGSGETPASSQNPSVSDQIDPKRSKRERLKGKSSKGKTRIREKPSEKSNGEDECVERGSGGQAGSDCLISSDVVNPLELLIGSMLEWVLRYAAAQSTFMATNSASSNRLLIERQKAGFLVLGTIVTNCPAVIDVGTGAPTLMRLPKKLPCLVVKDPILAFLTMVFFLTPERREMRDRVIALSCNFAAWVASEFSNIGPNFVARLFAITVALASHSSNSVRLIAIELNASLLSLPALQTIVPEAVAITAYLLSCKAHDETSIIRSRTLELLASLVNQGQGQGQQEADEGSEASALPGALRWDNLLQLLRVRIVDEKSLVRKACCSLLESLSAKAARTQLLVIRQLLRAKEARASEDADKCAMYGEGGESPACEISPRSPSSELLKGPSKTSREACMREEGEERAEEMAESPEAIFNAIQGLFSADVLSTLSRDEALTGRQRSLLLFQRILTDFQAPPHPFPPPPGGGKALEESGEARLITRSLNVDVLTRTTREILVLTADGEAVLAQKALDLVVSSFFLPLCEQLSHSNNKNTNKPKESVSGSGSELQIDGDQSSLLPLVFRSLCNEDPSALHVVLPKLPRVVQTAFATQALVVALEGEQSSDLVLALLSLAYDALLQLRETNSKSKLPEKIANLISSVYKNTQQLVALLMSTSTPPDPSLVAIAAKLLSICAVFGHYRRSDTLAELALSLFRTPFLDDPLPHAVEHNPSPPDPPLHTYGMAPQNANCVPIPFPLVVPALQIVASHKFDGTKEASKGLSNIFNTIIESAYRCLTAFHRQASEIKPERPADSVCMSQAKLLLSIETFGAALLIARELQLTLSKHTSQLSRIALTVLFKLAAGHLAYPCRYGAANTHTHTCSLPPTMNGDNPKQREVSEGLITGALPQEEEAQQLKREQDIAVLRALAYLSAGRVLVTSETLARRSALRFVGLAFTPDTVIDRTLLGNLALCISEMTLRMTSLGDPFIMLCSSTLSGRGVPAASDRFHVLNIVACLIAQDFVKARGLILCHVFAALGDPSLAVRELARDVIESIIVPRVKDFLLSYFAEMLCLMCGVITHPHIRIVLDFHPLQTSAVASVLDLSIHSFAFPDDELRRRRVYSGMLAAATNEQARNLLTLKLIDDFFAPFLPSALRAATTHAVDGARAQEKELAMPASTASPLGLALSDALKVLCSSDMELKLKMKPGGGGPTSASTSATVTSTGDNASAGGSTGGGVEEESSTPALKGVYEKQVLERFYGGHLLPQLQLLLGRMKEVNSTLQRDLLICIARVSQGAGFDDAALRDQILSLRNPEPGAPPLCLSRMPLIDDALA